MRIGIDARFYGALGKGLGRYTEKLIAGLEKIEDENEYFVFLRKENFDEYIPQNSRFHKVIADFQWYGWQEQVFFPRVLAGYVLDLVHFPHFNVPLLYRKPFVVTIHDLILLHFPTVKATELPPFLYWVKYIAYRFLISSAIQRSQAILTVSQFTKKDIENRYPQSREKISVTLEAADPSCAYISPAKRIEYLRGIGLVNSLEGGSPQVMPYCLYVGNAYPHKNLSLILDGGEAFPDIQFVLVGKEDYFYRQLRNLAESRKLSNIRFIGYVSDQYLSVLYEKAKAYIFPSFYEGFGLPGLEACAHGLPVLASSAGSLPEILDAAALYFDPKNKKEFLAGLTQILTDEEKRASLRRAGHLLQQRYRWDDLASKTHDIYKRVMKS